jgi:hypothetical protein
MLCPYHPYHELWLTFLFPWFTIRLFWMILVGSRQTMPKIPGTQMFLHGHVKVWLRRSWWDYLIPKNEYGTFF